MSDPASLSLQTTPLHPMFGVRVEDCDLRRAGEPEFYAAIRRAFEEHSLLLFPGQHLDDDEHLAFAKLFGPIEDRSNIRMDGAAKISGVSNETADGGVEASPESPPRRASVHSSSERGVRGPARYEQWA